MLTDGELTEIGKTPGGAYIDKSNDSSRCEWN